MSVDLRPFLRHLYGGGQVSDQLIDGLCDALAAPFGRAWLIAFGDGEAMGPWAAIADPRVAPAWGLPHAAMWVGGEMPGRRVGESEEAWLTRARQAVVWPRGMRRGSVGVLYDAVVETLVGNRSALIIEQANGDPYSVRVVTYAAETPDPSATSAAAHAAPIDASIVLTVATMTGQTFQQLRDGHADFAAVRAAYADFEAVRSDTPS